MAETVSVKKDRVFVFFNLKIRCFLTCDKLTRALVSV